MAKEGDPSGAVVPYYGFKVALDGNHALVSLSQNGVYFYKRSGANWLAGEPLPASGSRPAIDRDTALLGAYNYGGQIGFGIVTVLDYDGAKWIPVATLEPLDKYDGNWFGWSVALSGSVAVVGAVRYDTGKAYVFERDQTGVWKQTAKLSPDMPGTSEHFGWVVATDSETVVVGAPYDWSSGVTSGASYIFERDENAAWAKKAKLLSPDPVSLGAFGYSVAVRDDVMLIGSPSADVVCCAEGAVFVYRRTGTEWSHVQTLTTAAPQNSEVFGGSLALQPGVAIVGAPGSNSKGPESGAAYVFVSDFGKPWKEVAKLVPSETKPWDNFGTSVAISGMIGLIGMWQQNPDPPTQPGFARFYAVGPDNNGNGLMDACECPGDVDKDWDIDQSDLGLLLAYWGKCPGDPGYYPAANFGGDPCIEQADLGALLANFGNVCP